jgi:hypothetical protein
MNPEFSGKIFEKYSNKIFTKMCPVGGRVAQCGRMDGQKKTDRQREIKKTVFADRNFSNALKNGQNY